MVAHRVPARATLACRRLARDDDRALRDLQHVFDAAPGYSEVVTGRPPAATAARDTFESCPSTIDIECKHVLGFYLNTEIVACADLIEGYPAPDTAWLGLLLVCERHQSKGLGPQALTHIAHEARALGCHALRLGVIETNTRALVFWRREGFTQIDIRPMPEFTGRALILERAL